MSVNHNAVAKESPLPILGRQSSRPEVHCSCGFSIFDGEVIRARVVRLVSRGVEAKCRCKRWVPVPLAYAP